MRSQSKELPPSVSTPIGDPGGTLGLAANWRRLEGLQRQLAVTREPNERFMKQRVLIIDDDAGVREAIATVLQGAGYEVLTAADPEAAEVQFVRDQIDLVLLDLNLPVRNGWEVFERLTTRFPLVPVIIITGMPDQYRTATAAGVGVLMEKPIEAPALLKAVEELVAEPVEVRLRRLCGYRLDTKHVPSPEVVPKDHFPPISARPSSCLQGTPITRFIRKREE